MSDEKLFQEIYKIDGSTKLYMVEIALDQYTDIFSEWDPAPFKRRSIDPDLELYLEGSSEEIPVRYPVELYFTIPTGTHNQMLEDEVRYGLRNSFMFKLYLIRKELRKTNVLMLRYSVFGFLFLATAKLFSSRLPEESWLTLITEALFIGGWVFVWEAVSLFFFSNREIYGRYQIYKRLRNAPVIFQEVDRSRSRSESLANAARTHDRQETL